MFRSSEGISQLKKARTDTTRVGWVGVVVWRVNDFAPTFSMSVDEPMDGHIKGRYAT